MRIKKLNVGLIALGVLAGCAVSPQKVPGRYSQTAPSGHEIMQLNTDGSFIKYRDDREIIRGRWHLTHHFLDTGIELDTESAPGVDASADEYRLTTRDERPCWEIERDYEYWCKIQIPQ
jgi:hypothetical protein